MDGDGQDDPADISRLLKKFTEGFDVVSGWRAARENNALTPRLPSVIANWLISTLLPRGCVGTPFNPDATIFCQNGRMPDERTLMLRHADQARTDFAIIEYALEAIRAWLARITRRRIWRGARSA